MNNVLCLITTPLRFIAAAERQYGTSDPAKFNRLMDKLDTMDVDHIKDLQLGGLDDASNLWLLDSEVNQGIGRQIWQQIKNLADGTIISDINIIGL